MLTDIELRIYIQIRTNICVQCYINFRSANEKFFSVINRKILDEQYFLFCGNELHSFRYIHYGKGTFSTTCNRYVYVKVNNHVHFS